ncbi:MAG: 6-carboxytetrahydropterin synthase [Lentimicrobiaceae bacterium]|jgi:6-pyruvoyltetrahydropterin/6-carboxytetrahydropterin synthase|nr:6-carboxytetrahydropterin synthase [Lentimicrobiaceae bacterium]MCP4911338.1 6-carboxytetrahydropterin synthase [Bacteroidota bacterium]MBT3454068.1 6-carboxytetrahydropterin synthase [Lentimicrobiaceae bacterium]MBT3819186.1 6-carboxytetrahydropterin synthase [Lentimicrobiaceae bacterium]MBT4060615.1 6-carboxytetrahydropterin synthase [Lentimicrobiaceae bacterium]
MKQSTIRITKEFKFEMAHALKGYDGPCKNIHGHSYELSVTISGKPINDENNPKLGMVMDFGELKKIVRREVVDLFDHALVLNSSMNTDLLKSLSKNFEKVILTDYQPTSEMMIIDFARRISAELPSHVTLKYMLLRETVTSFAEWYADEN